MEEDFSYDQDELNAYLRRGIIFSIIWVAGIYSIKALRIGLDALKIIKESNNRLKGKKRAYWCIIVGAFGVLVWLPLWLFLFIK